MVYFGAGFLVSFLVSFLTGAGLAALGAALLDLEALVGLAGVFFSGDLDLDGDALDAAAATDFATEGLAMLLATEALRVDGFAVALRVGVFTGLGFLTSFIADFLAVDTLALGARLAGDGDLAGSVLRGELLAGDGLAGDFAGVLFAGELFTLLLTGEGLREDFLGVGDATDLRGLERIEYFAGEGSATAGLTTGL